MEGLGLLVLGETNTFVDEKRLEIAWYQGLDLIEAVNSYL